MEAREEREQNGYPARGGVDPHRADDVEQELRLKELLHPARFKGARNPVAYRNRARFNELNNSYRREGKRPAPIGDEAVIERCDQLRTGEDPAETVVGRDQGRRVHLLFDRAVAEHRITVSEARALREVYFKGRSQSEVAEEFGMTRQAVNKAVRSGARKLFVELYDEFRKE